MSDNTTAAEPTKTTIEVPELDEAWQRVLAKCDEIKATRHPTTYGFSRDVAQVTTDGGAVSTVMSVGLQDGTSAVYVITAYTSKRPWMRGRTQEIRVKQYIDEHAEYWESQIANEPDRRVVIGNTHYRLGKNGSRRGPYNGFGGRRFDIEFFDGRVVTTYDLWHQGVVPPSFRDRLPDNARWAVPAEAPDIAIPLRFEP
jgi:hypothetical protein